MDITLAAERGLQILFFIIVIVFVIYTVLMVYHWHEYGSSKKMTSVALAVYLLGAATLFIIMSLSVF